MTPSLTELFSRHHETLLAAWFETVSQRHPDLATAPGATVDPAADLRDALAACLFAVKGEDRPLPPELARWFAVQDAPPEDALICLYALKPLLRCHILPHTQELMSYLEAESRLDSLAVLLFGDYVRCRERLHAARLAAAEQNIAGLRRWAQERGFFAGSAS